MSRSKPETTRPPAFDADTVQDLAELLELFEAPCCLLCPGLGEEMHRRGRPVAVFDTEIRRDDMPGHRIWDVRRPVYLDRDFDLVVCNATHEHATLSQLFHALRVLCHYEYERPILIAFPVAKAPSLQRAFDAFGLEPTGYRVAYDGGEDVGAVELYANWEVPLGRLDEISR